LGRAKMDHLFSSYFLVRAIDLWGRGTWHGLAVKTMTGQTSSQGKQSTPGFKQRGLGRESEGPMNGREAKGRRRVEHRSTEDVPSAGNRRGGKKWDYVQSRRGPRVADRGAPVVRMDGRSDATRVWQGRGEERAEGMGCGERSGRRGGEWRG